MNPQIAWSIARASGIVAWALTAGSVIWGLALSTRLLGRRPPPGWLQDLHRFLGGLAVIFTAVHMIALALDDYLEWSLAAFFVPFGSPWRPGAVAWGVIALYLLVSVEATSLLRRRLPTRWWHRIHLLSLPLYVAGTAHLLAAGTDAGNPLLLATVFAGTTAIAFLGAFRVLAPRRRTRRQAARARPHPRQRTATPSRCGAAGAH